MKRFGVGLLIALVTFAVGLALGDLRKGSSKSPAVGRSRNAGPAPETEWNALGTGTCPRRIGALPVKVTDPDKASIRFVDDRNGFFSDGKGLWRTVDGGINWDPIETPDPGKGGPSSIARAKFIDENVGWTISDGALFRTGDGGMSWKAMRPAVANGEDSSGGPADFDFLRGGEVGWLIENHYRPLAPRERADDPNPYHNEISPDRTKVMSSEIYFTQDGGITWALQPIEPTWNALELITGFDRDHAWAFGYGGVYYLNDGKWLPARSQPRAGVEDSWAGCLEIACGSNCVLPVSISFVDPKTGWISNANGYVGRSDDGGKTWGDMSYGLWEGFGDPKTDVLHFVDRSNGWALDGEGKLRVTTNAGASWFSVNDGLYFLKMTFVDGNRGWLITEDSLYKLPEINSPT